MSGISLPHIVDVCFGSKGQCLWVVEERHSTNYTTDVTTNGSAKVVNALLAAGADSKATDKWGAMALITASKHAKIKVASALLAVGEEVKD